jgi:hypothetical protein
MTQTELEQIARQLRDIGLHASWSELMVLADSVVGNLVDVYQTLSRNSLASNDTSLTLDNNVYMTLQDKLSKAIASLTNEEMVARWRSEACGGDLLKKQ